MKIEHIAIWTNNLDKLKDFYEKYFGAKSNSIYINTKKGFSSYFLSFDSGARIEIMTKAGLEKSPNNNQIGITHFAFSVGSKEKVIELTEKLGNSGIEILSQPRTTGDGYFESLVKDPDGNLVEITI